MVEVGSSRELLWRDAVGAVTFETSAASVDEATLFDLASLTKVVATTTVLMDHVRTRTTSLELPIADVFSEWQGKDRDDVSVRDLLDHSSGLAARLLEAPPVTAREFLHDICVMPLEYPPRSRSIYSDLGFILLGLLATERSGRTLAEQFDETRDRLAAADPILAAEPLRYASGLPDKGHAAPTSPDEDDPRRGRRLVGEVHDRYAATLGDTAGHAGLFGTVGAVGAFSRLMLRAARGDDGVPEPLSPARVALFVTKSAVPGSSRALGWDTMLPTSSCGTRMSPSAFGHVGFTGTSLWIDPIRDRYFVLLANRTMQGGALAEMREVRRAFHDELGEI